MYDEKIISFEHINPGDPRFDETWKTILAKKPDLEKSDFYLIDGKPATRGTILGRGAFGTVICLDFLDSEASFVVKIDDFGYRERKWVSEEKEISENPAKIARAIECYRSQGIDDPELTEEEKNSSEIQKIRFLSMFESHKNRERRKRKEELLSEEKCNRRIFGVGACVEEGAKNHLLLKRLPQGLSKNRFLEFKTNRDALEWFIRVLEAVYTLHQKYGIVHRDLKIENLCEDRETNEIIICDYGKAVDNENSTLESDQKTTEKLYFYKDIYSLGQLLQDMETANQTNLKEKKEGYYPLFDNPKIKSIHDSMIHTDPSKRPELKILIQSLKECASKLDEETGHQYLLKKSGKQSIPPPPSFPPPPIPDLQIFSTHTIDQPHSKEVKNKNHKDILKGLPIPPPPKHAPPPIPIPAPVGKSLSVLTQTIPQSQEESKPPLSIKEQALFSLKRRNQLLVETNNSVSNLQGLSDTISANQKCLSAEELIYAMCQMMHEVAQLHKADVTHGNIILKNLVVTQRN